MSETCVGCGEHKSLPDNLYCKTCDKDIKAMRRYKRRRRIVLEEFTAVAGGILVSAGILFLIDQSINWYIIIGVNIGIFIIRQIVYLSKKGDKNEHKVFNKSADRKEKG
jgi:hypothetical protein